MKDNKLYIIHMKECMDRILAYTAEGRDAFMADRKTQDAVLRNFEVMGEAAKRVSQDFRGLHPGVPWRRMAGFRDVLIHRYEHVDTTEVWSVVEKELPELKRKIEAILEEMGG